MGFYITYTEFTTGAGDVGENSGSRMSRRGLGKPGRHCPRESVGGSGLPPLCQGRKLPHWPLPGSVEAALKGRRRFAREGTC